MNSIITQYDYICDILQDFISHPSGDSVDLLICSTREEFFRQILLELEHHALRDQVQAAPPQPEAEFDDQERTALSASNVLLSGTLRTLSASQHVRLIYCPTPTVLRGYLSGYMPESPVTSQARGSLIIVNLLALHHGTSEFTLQGLSQTFATAVSAATRVRRGLKLVESKDVSDPANPNRGSALWQADVRLLSAAIKIGQEGQNWGRRTIPVAKVASRWFVMADGAKIGQDKEAAIGRTGLPAEDEMLL